MDYMGVDPEIALRILEDELANYQATRFRYTTRLRILNRVEADPAQRQGLEKELVALEAIIAAYEAEMIGVGVE